MLWDALRGKSAQHCSLQNSMAPHAGLPKCMQSQTSPPFGHDLLQQKLRFAIESTQHGVHLAGGE